MCGILLRVYLIGGVNVGKNSCLISNWSCHQIFLLSTFISRLTNKEICLYLSWLEAQVIKSLLLDNYFFMTRTEFRLS